MQWGKIGLMVLVVLVTMKLVNRNFFGLKSLTA